MDYYDRISELKKINKWDEIIEYTSKYLTHSNASGWQKPLKYELYKDRGLAYEGKNNFNIAKDDYESALKDYIRKFGNDNITHSLVYYFICYRLASVCIELKEYYNARRWITCAFGNYELRPCVNDTFEKIEKSIRENRLLFVDQNYYDRKFIMPVTKMNGCNGTSINVFTMNDLPKEIRFTTGYAQPYELYIGHPYVKDLYIPYKDSSEFFLENKVGELCVLLQALGAAEIEIMSVKGIEVSRMYQNQKSFGGNGGTGKFSGSMSYNNSYENSYLYNRNNKKIWKQVFNPNKSAYIPDNLVWYPNELNWKNIALQRLNGGMLEYSFECSSKEIEETIESKSTNIAVSAAYLCKLAGVSYNNSSYTTSREITESVWKIDVKFYSNNYKKESVTDLFELNGEAEEAYKAEIEFCLRIENGDITQFSRKYLQQKRDSLGISQQRAGEIERYTSFNWK